MCTVEKTKFGTIFSIPGLRHNMCVDTYGVTFPSSPYPITYADVWEYIHDGALPADITYRPPPLKVCDLGAGLGGFADWAVKRGHHATVVDPAPYHEIDSLLEEALGYYSPDDTIIPLLTVLLSRTKLILNPTQVTLHNKTLKAALRDDPTMFQSFDVIADHIGPSVHAGYDEDALKRWKRLLMSPHSPYFTEY